jgi:hypothetical protein
VFEAQLRGVIDMLVLASPAISEIWARRGHTGGGGFDYPKQAGPRKPFFNFNNFDLDYLSGQDEWNEHDKILVTSHAFSAKSNIGYGEN